MALALGDVVVGWREGADHRLRQYDSGGASLGFVAFDLGNMAQRVAIYGDTSIYVTMFSGSILSGFARYDANLTKVWEHIYAHSDPLRVNDPDPNFRPIGISVGGSPSAIGVDDVVYVCSYNAPYQIRKYSADNVLLDTFEDLTAGFYYMHVNEDEQVAYLNDGVSMAVDRYDLQSRAMLSPILTVPAPYDVITDLKQKPDGRFLISVRDNPATNPRIGALDIAADTTIAQTYSDTNGWCEAVGYDGEDALWMHRSTVFKKWNVTSGVLELSVTPPASMASNGAIGVVYRYPPSGPTTAANARAWGHVIG